MSLKESIEALHEQQTAAVKVMCENFAALKGVESRDFNFGPMKVRAVYNPARAVSSAAKVDKATIAARPCFLCAANRLEGQQSVNCLNDRYEVLVNPYPIFKRHFVIASKEHEPQAIEGRVGDMWELARELEGYTVFYNGPRCGASAPDHLHFQAVPSAELPLWEALQKTALQPMAAESEAVLSKAVGLPIDVMVIDAVTADGADRLMEALLPFLPISDSEEWEPRFNLLATSMKSMVRMAVVPRPCHRPSFYTGDPTDESGMTVSPASVDVAGVLVMPRRIDFDRLDEKTIRTIFNETCRTSC